MSTQTFAVRSYLTGCLLSTLVLGAVQGTSGQLLFEDTFHLPSRGLRERNRVVDAPPEGMGYTTDTPFGYRLKNWLIADSEPALQRRAFWCIPQRASGEIKSYMQQAARERSLQSIPNTH